MAIGPCSKGHAAFIPTWQADGTSQTGKKAKKQKDYAFRRQFYEKPRVILSCPGVQAKHVALHMVEAYTHLHPHLVIGGNNRPVVEVVLLYEEGDEVHVLEDQVRLSAQAEMLSLHRQQLACCFKGAHLKVLAGTHLVLHQKGGLLRTLFSAANSDSKHIGAVSSGRLLPIQDLQT